MPADFVERWEPLRKLADRLSDTQERLTQLAQSAPPTLTPTRGHSKEFRPKSADEYAAMIRGGVQVRSRHHERLVKEVGELLQQAGAVVSTPHPIDLLMTSPHMVIFEAKIVGGRDPALAVREAVGQLLEYRYFLGPRDAELCIVLDEEPPALLISYVEDELRMWIAWCQDRHLATGPKSRILPS